MSASNGNIFSKIERGQLGFVAAVTSFSFCRAKGCGFFAYHIRLIVNDKLRSIGSTSVKVAHVGCAAGEEFCAVAAPGVFRSPMLDQAVFVRQNVVAQVTLPVVWSVLDVCVECFTGNKKPLAEVAPFATVSGSVLAMREKTVGCLKSSVAGKTSVVF